MKRRTRRAPVEVKPPAYILKAREDFAAFCTLMGKPPAEHMKSWHEAIITGESNDNVLDIAGPDICLLSPRGPLDLSTPVLTPDGWRPLRSIKKGATVYSSLGMPVKVKDVMHYGKAPCWEVVMSDGTTLICDDSHKWLVRRAFNPDADWKSTTLEELRAVVCEVAEVEGARKRVTRRAEASEKPWLDGQGRPRWQVPMTRPVAREEMPMPIEPYLMGVLLGRGALSGSGIRFTSSDTDVIERAEASLPEGCRLRKAVGATEVWAISGYTPPGVKLPKRAPRNPILPPLETLGLWGATTWERPFPGVYLEGSIAQRMALLQGLMDAAGNVQTHGGLSLTVRSHALAEGALELVRSLGGTGAIKSLKSNRRRDSLVLFMILPEGIEPFHCRTKIGRQESRGTRRRKPMGLNRLIVDIRPAGEREIGCITVDTPLHDFVVKDYVVSCNSAKSTVIGMLCAWLIGKHTLANKLLRILYVSFNVDVARAKSLGIKNTIASEEYKEVFPTVRFSKNKTADELWSIDFEHAGIDVRGEDAFTVACAGLKGTITSKRSDLVILDDLIKSEMDIKNPETRREMERNWNAVIVPTRFQGGRAIALGTRFHFDDIFATTFTEEKRWIVKIQGALLYDDDGAVRSYWPDMWSLKYLQGLKDNDAISFSYQYMNQAVRSTDLGMSPELLVKGQIPDSFDVIGVSMDLSAGLGERNDYTVFMLGGRDGDKGYIIDKRRLRTLGNIEKCEALVDLLHEWNLVDQDAAGKYWPTRSEVMVWPESVAYQRSFEGDFKRIVYEEWGLTNLRISPVKGARGDKLAKFRGVMGLFETHRVIFNKYRDFNIVWDEVLNLGHASHDDCADALQILLDQMFRRTSVEIEWA